MEFWNHCVGYGKLRIITMKEYLREDWEYVGEDDYSGYTVVYSPSINAYCCVKMEGDVDDE